MKKLSLIAGMASLATVALLWSLPAAAFEAHDKWPARAHEMSTNTGAADSDGNTGSTDPAGTSVPEPGTLALLALGLGGLGAYSLSRRRRVKA